MENRKIRRLARRGGATLLTLGLALGGFSVFAPGAGAEGGNNGTVKIGDVVLDNGPSNDNDPMVQCPIVIEWFGFDGTASTTATITPHNDAKGEDVLFTQSWDIPDTKDVPVQEAINPDLSSLEQGPHGYHVRVTVETTTSTGQSDTKSKVIWVEGPCGEQGGGEPTTASAIIQVSKALTGNNIPNNPGDFSFTVDCGSADVSTHSLAVAAGGSSTATVTWDASGDAPSCTVTESSQKGATSTTWSVDGGAATTTTVASTGALTDGGTTQVAFTNDYTRTGDGNPGCEPNCGGDAITPTPDVPQETPIVNNPAPVVIPAETVEAPTTTIPTQVEGVQIVAPAAQPQVLGTELARTGAMTDRLIVAAGLCLLLGGLALIASKERTATAEAPTRRR